MNPCATWKLGTVLHGFFFLACDFLFIEKPNLKIHSPSFLYKIYRRFTSESKSKREHPRPWSRSRSRVPWQRRIRWSWHCTSWWAHQQQQQSHQWQSSRQWQWHFGPPWEQTFGSRKHPKQPTRLIHMPSPISVVHTLPLRTPWHR